MRNMRHSAIPLLSARRSSLGVSRSSLPLLRRSRAGVGTTFLRWLFAACARRACGVVGGPRLAGVGRADLPLGVRDAVPGVATRLEGSVMLKCWRGVLGL
jgi:hypothetical protein